MSVLSLVQKGQESWDFYWDVLLTKMTNWQAFSPINISRFIPWWYNRGYCLSISRFLTGFCRQIFRDGNLRDLNNTSASTTNMMEDWVDYQQYSCFLALCSTKEMKWPLLKWLYRKHFLKVCLEDGDNTFIWLGQWCYLYNSGRTTNKM